MGRTLRVALLVETSHGYGRRLLQGIAAYSKTHGPWTFHHEERAFDDPAPAGLKQWQPDGIIARIATPSLGRDLRRLRVPVVDLYDEGLCPRCSRVNVNNREVVRLAVDHLRECGFQNLAYVGYPRTRFSLERSQLFAECVGLWRLMPHIYTPPSDGRVRRLATIEAGAVHHSESLAAWLRSLPKPVGLMACNDMRAQQVLSLCAEHGISVPDTIGVIGVDNDEVRCDLAAPSLSSIDPNAYRVGYEAAALLHRLILGQRRTPQTRMVDPLGVVRRGSTDVLAFADPEIAEIVRMIRERAFKGLTVERLVQQSGVSRATLDRWFLKHLGRTPHAEITRIQVQRARELLSTTDMPLKQVARLAGFSHVETMYRVFEKATRQTPSQYRRATSGRSPLTDR